ncbi:MAG: hypothetical protein AB4352_08280 [Hormoscilla sp.]
MIIADPIISCLGDRISSPSNKPDRTHRSQGDRVLAGETGLYELSPWECENLLQKPGFWRDRDRGAARQSRNRVI